MDHSNNGRSLGALSSPQRNHYFYGKLMDVPHFEMEQRYSMKQRWLLNRLGLGSGMLCGLRVTVKDDKVCVSPGVAIDRCGREIVVPHEVCIDPWTLTDECGCPKTPPLSKTEAHDVYLCLAYKECQTDFMPVLVTDCNTKQQCLPGTTVEGFCVIVKEGEGPQPENGLHDKLCQFLRSDATEQAKRHRLCELISKASHLIPDEKETCVVLGTVSLKDDGTIDKTDKNEPEPDQCSVRSTLVSNEHLLDMLLCLSGRGGGSTTPTETGLTRIERFSGWTRVDQSDREIFPLHNQEILLKDFPHRLEVVFDHDVPTFPMNGRAWFIVTLEWQEGNVPRVERFAYNAPAAAIPGLLLTLGSDVGLTMTLGISGTAELHNKKASFTFDETKQFFKAVRGLPQPVPDETEAVKVLCRVVVKCDFLLDENEKAVDGDHLGGTLPSGDGIPGGDFESWFTLILPVPPVAPPNG